MQIKVVVSGTIPAVSLSARTLTFNAAAYTGLQTIAVKTNDKDCPVPVKYVITPSSTNIKVKAEAEKVKFSTDGWNITAGLDLNNVPINGNYAYLVKAYVTNANGDEVELKTASLTVRVVTTAAKVALDKTKVTLNQQINESCEIIPRVITAGYDIADMEIKTTNATAKENSALNMQTARLQLKLRKMT